jgi:hypothetical protein
VLFGVPEQVDFPERAQRIGIMGACFGQLVAPLPDRLQRASESLQGGALPAGFFGRSTTSAAHCDQESSYTRTTFDLNGGGIRAAHLLEYLHRPRGRHRGDDHHEEQVSCGSSSAAQCLPATHADLGMCLGVYFRPSRVVKPLRCQTTAVSDAGGAAPGG